MLKGGYTPEAYYAAPFEEFAHDVRYSYWLAQHMAEVHNDILSQDLKPVTKEQLRAWESSFFFLRKLIEEIDVCNDPWIVLEPVLRGTRNRIDALLCGKDEKGICNAALLEFKTWHTSRRKRSKI